MYYSIQSAARVSGFLVWMSCSSVKQFNCTAIIDWVNANEFSKITKLPRRRAFTHAKKPLAQPEIRRPASAIQAAIRLTKSGQFVLFAFFLGHAVGGTGGGGVGSLHALSSMFGQRWRETAE